MWSDDCRERTTTIKSGAAATYLTDKRTKKVSDRAQLQAPWEKALNDGDAIDVDLDDSHALMHIERAMAIQHHLTPAPTRA